MKNNVYLAQDETKIKAGKEKTKVKIVYLAALYNQVHVVFNVLNGRTVRVTDYSMMISACRFLPAEILTFPQMKSSRLIIVFSSLMELPLTRAPPPRIKRRASPFDFAKPTMVSAEITESAAAGSAVMET